MVVDRHQGLRLRTAKLAAAATALKYQSGRNSPFSLVFMTDQARVTHPELIARILPKGAAVILRDYDLPQRAALARRLSIICKARGISLLIAGNPDLAIAVDASGVHRPRWSTLTKADLPVRFLLTASCHNKNELTEAEKIGADLAILSPAFETRSHPDGNVLGARGFKAIAENASIPIIALGGVTAVNANQLTGPNVVGLAAIGAFWGD
ncbi:thiamine phosphate synthase [Hyphococcus formosus]|uniref:thiamine phosphate synthase n=1 Tax=Hyphococcus formosus TaxID=3143534 RepID=UPI00398B609D